MSNDPVVAIEPDRQGIASAEARTTIRDSTLARGRELLAIGLLIVFADLTIYRGGGYAGFAAFFAGAPVLLAIGSRLSRFSWWSVFVGLLIVVLALRLVWSGAPIHVLIGLASLAAFAGTLVGHAPHVLETMLLGASAVFLGGLQLLGIARSIRYRPNSELSGWLKVVLPLAAVGGFGSLFVLANPDIRDFVARHSEQLREWFRQFGLHTGEVIFWAVTAWLAAGLLRPILSKSALGPLYNELRRVEQAPILATPAMYAAWRNTLLALIALFAVYLAFEFQTLWFRTFPKGFYYAGYAHEGAAWLTVALALATGVLSTIFRGPILEHPSLPTLRRLAWTWAGLNLVLAAAVYNRLFIYIGFNGMTRMRTVGLLGISTVVAGFLFVIWKIAKNRDFVWLIQRDLWALSAAIFIYVVTPVDFVVHSYNVRRVMAGDLAPVVQVTEHPIDNGGMLALIPLTESPDPIIRDGVRAMLAARWDEVDLKLREQSTGGWTAYQHSDHLLKQRLDAERQSLQQFVNPTLRSEAIRRFKDYAYQWY